MLSKKEELTRRIELLEKEKDKIEKELQNPFLSRTLRDKYKKDIKLKAREIEELKKRILLLDV